MRSSAVLALPLTLVAAPAVAAEGDWAEDDAELAVDLYSLDDDSYPWRDVFEAFATACSAVQDAAVNKASVAAAQWEDYTPDAEDRLGRLVAYGEQEIAKEVLGPDEEPTELLPGSTWRKQVAGRQLYVALSGARVSDIRSTGCRLYDFDAPADPGPERVENWVQRAIGSEERPGEGLVKYIWNPGITPASMELEIAFVAPEADPIPGVPLQGLVMTATALEIEGL